MKRMRQITKSKCRPPVPKSKRAISKRGRDQKPQLARMGRMCRGAYGERGPAGSCGQVRRSGWRGAEMMGRVILINWDGNMTGKQNYFEVL
jgi:hypothetical protein